MATKVSGKKATGTRKRKERKNIERGAVHIQSTFNNTIVTITDTQGNAVSWATCRRNGLQRLKKIYSLCCSDCCRDQLPRLLWSTV